MSTLKIWRNSITVWTAMAVSALFLGLIYLDGLSYMVKIWERQEEYSHGYLIPLISLFFVWQKKNELEKLPFAGSWTGILILVVGLLLYVLGEFSTLYIIIQYSFLVSLLGLLVAWVGWPGIRVIWVPLLFLAFMIPLPNFLFQGLSAQLQLISTEIGVWVIRLFDISVYVEGNVIDLGTYKLQVVEACSGLRYLFPLMTLGFMMAYIYKAPFWKRAILFLSTIPITVLMNSFRIGVIGVMVEHWGQSMAEGFLHDFEGWVVFMACLGVLLLEMAILSRIGSHSEEVRNAFAIDLPEPTPESAVMQRRKVPPSLAISVAVLGVAVVLSKSIGDRETFAPERSALSGFPAVLGDWRGQGDKLEQIYLDILKLDDHVMTDYMNRDGDQVNFYVAYYESQAKGEAAHSPRACLPGGGWKIVDLQRRTMSFEHEGAPIAFNRVVIKKGDYTQLVYYWFHGRGRTITSEYMVKWYLFWDALTRNRTDGALIRLTTLLGPDESLNQGDERLTEFLGLVREHLDRYVPD